jgi:hypothetical protein
MRVTIGRALIVLGLLAAAVVIVWAVMPGRIPVEVVAVTKGRFIVSVDEGGKTRVRERYAVAAPLAGRLGRVRFKVGDQIRVDDAVATIMPSPVPFLDLRSRRETEERLGAAEATLERADRGAIAIRTQLTLVGRYRGDASNLSFTLKGQVNGEEQTFVYSGLNFPARAGGDSFIARLWATRRIGDLLNSIRLNLKPLMLFLFAGEMIASTDGLAYRIALLRRHMGMNIIIPYVLWVALLLFLVERREHLNQYENARNGCQRHGSGHYRQLHRSGRRDGDLRSDGQSEQRFRHQQQHRRGHCRQQRRPS